MKQVISLSIFIVVIVLCSSCRNKTVELLAKKWDCVQVENIFPTDSKFLSPQDSINTVQLQTMLQSLNWTFNKDRTYACAIGSRVTVQGTYELLEKDKILFCTPESNGNTNSYNIQALTENELVLKTITGNSNIVLHFKPN